MAGVTAMPLIDTHCHLDFPAFDNDRDLVLQQARTLGIGAILIPGVSAARWPQVLALCAGRRTSRYPRLLPALGLHPAYCDQHCPADVERLRLMLRSGRAVAIGEIGLDFSHAPENTAIQRQYFARQLALAAELSLPLLLHVRKAHDCVLEHLRATQVCGGIVHASSGSVQQARAYIDLGFKLGFGGMLTYARSRKLRALARALPLDALVLETDAPDMSVASHQYQRNSPEYLPEILAALAEARATCAASLARATTVNALDVLGLDAHCLDVPP